MCDDLFFDKTKNLDGYNLKTALFRIPYVYEYNETKIGYDIFYGAHYTIICTILKHVNASITVKKSKSAGFLDGHGKPQHMLGDVLSSTVDLALNAYYQRDHWKVQSYPFSTSALKIISSTNSTGYLIEFPVSYKLKVLTGLIALSCICIIPLKYILQESTSEAGLDCLRMFVSAATRREPDEFSKKLFYLTLMFSLFTISSYIQSSLTAVNVVPDERSNIDTVEELIGSGLSVYGRLNYKDLITDEEIRKRFHPDTIDGCFNRLFKAEKIVCIYPDLFVKFYIYENQTTHISKGGLSERSLSYTFAEDSPLRSKFSWVLQKMSEAGLIRLFYERHNMYFLRNYAESNTEESLDMIKLKIVFYILMGGWLLAVLAFLLENVYYIYIKLRVKN